MFLLGTDGTSGTLIRVDLTTFEALLSPTGQTLLAEVTARIDSEPALGLGEKLRRDHPATLVAAAITTVELRRRAVNKFGDDASALYFTPEALEQSTRGAVADHRARKLAAHGVSHVVDLGCGIGADLIACARAGMTVRAVDIDPVRAAMAAANLAALGLDGTVTCADASDTSIAAHEVAFVDPARRDGRGRVFSTSGLTPAWTFVSELLRGTAVAKVMPGIAHGDIPDGVEAEWVSENGDLVEASLWGVPFATATRRATVLPSAEFLVARGAAATVAPPHAWLLEPDDAVIRAGLVAELADDLGGHLIDEHIAWISAPQYRATALGRWFKVVEELPFHEKQLKAALRSRDIGTLTVKKRGVDIVPEALIRRLKLSGTRPATLVMTRSEGRGIALLVEPVTIER